MAAESLEESPRAADEPTPDEAAPEKEAKHEEDEGEEGAPERATKEPGAWPYLRERYFSMDRRLLGLFRIYFGFLLLIDMVRRIPEATFFYSNEGVLSNHFSLYAPMIKPYFSLFTAFSTPTEVKVAFVLTAFAHCFYIVGYRTKVAQIVSFVLYTSLNTRNHFVENGGCVMVALVACWSMFLPLGDRFSVDAVLKSLRARRDFTAASLNDREGIRPDTTPHVTLVALCFLLQIAVCYFFNTVHKHGLTWKNGEAVHWVLWQNRIATHLAAWLRMHEPPGFSWFTSKGALVIEGIAALLVLTPVGYRLTRPLNFLLTTSLHLGIAALCTLGPFSYVMVALNGMALPSNVFDALSRWIRRGLTRRTVVYDPTDAGIHHVARILSRLDTYELLTFVDSADKDALPPKAPKATVAVFDQENERWTVGTAAIASAARSLPLGWLWGLLLDNGAGQGLLRALLRRRARLVASYYLEPGRRFDHGGYPHEPGFEMTPWREHVSSTLVVLRESMVSVVLLAAFFQVMHDNWWIPPKYRLEVPAALRPINLYPRLLQGWSMFSPEAPKTDGTLVVDGVTVDGRHLDPLTGKEPDFEAPLHGPWFHSQLQCDWTLKISFDGNKGYRDELKRYLLNWQRIERRPPNDRIVSFDLYWVSNDAPPPGSTEITNIRKKLLMSGKLPRPPPRVQAPRQAKLHNRGPCLPWRTGAMLRPMVSRPAIRHLPALDGLRGLALLGVLFFHADGALRGGYLGVDLFFVLSGYLITALLLVEHQRQGSIALGPFWVRRARRLMPALLSLMPAVALHARFLAEPGALAGLRAEALATLGYVANWRAILAKKSYWDLFAAPSPLEHTWSLAIEEQFYVLWPPLVLLLLRRGRGALLGATAALGACSVGAALALYDPASTSRVYLGTDTRAAGILAGAALAQVLPMDTAFSPRAVRWLDFFGIAAASGLAVAWWRLGGAHPFLYRGGLWLTELAALILIACAVAGPASLVGRALAFRPLTLVGTISYGLYLWHWPINVALTAERTRIHGLGLHALRFALTFAVAIASYRLLERPIRQRGLPWRRPWLVVPASVGLAVAVVLAGTWPRPLPPPPAVAAPAGPVTFPILILGDSTANSLGWVIRGLRAPGVSVELRGQDGCTMLADMCRGPLWAQDTEELRPKATLVFLGGAFLHGLSLDDGWRTACYPGWRARFEETLTRRLGDLRAPGVRVWLATIPYPLGPYDNEEFRGLTDCINASIRSSAAAVEGVHLLDLGGRLCPASGCERVSEGVQIRPDGVHYTMEGGAALARWLLERLQEPAPP